MSETLQGKPFPQHLKHPASDLDLTSYPKSTVDNKTNQTLDNLYLADWSPAVSKGPVLIHSE